MKIIICLKRIIITHLDKIKKIMQEISVYHDTVSLSEREKNLI